MTDADAPSSKVGRMIKRYGLDDVGDELERRWTRQEDRWSLRDLADWFNQRLLESAMNAAGLQPVDGEVANKHRLLTDDTVSDADRIQVRRMLERDGVDVERITNDFVTYQAIRTYLQDVRGASYDRSQTLSAGRARERIDRLVGRTTNVAEESLEQLRRNETVDLGEYRLLVDVQVYCESCDSQYSIGDLLDRGGCDCRSKHE